MHFIGTHADAALFSGQGQPPWVNQFYIVNDKHWDRANSYPEFNSFRDSIIALPPAYYISMLDATGFTETDVGGGSSSTFRIPYTTLATGVNNTNERGLVSSSPFWIDKDNVRYRFRFSTRIIIPTVTTEVEVWIGLFDADDDEPTVNDNHVAFRILSTDGNDADIYASNGNGAGTQTEVLSSLSTDAGIDLCIKYMGNNIKFYLGAEMALVATHTTNRPDNVNLYPGFWIKTTEGVVKQLDIYGGFRMLHGGE